MERLLVTQALDEKAMLVKRINSAIEKASFVEAKKKNEEKVMTVELKEEEFVKRAEASYQQINDLIKRYQKIEAAIIASNAATKITTSYGEMTVAGAISLRNRISNVCYNNAELDFEKSLADRMSLQLANYIELVKTRTDSLMSTAENMRLSILGKDSKGKEDVSLKVVDEYIKENTTVLVDPLNIRDKIQELTEKREKLRTELESQIKISNATTYIEI